MGDSRGLVRECETKTCPAYPYRMGTNPAKKGQGASAEHMESIRGSRKTLIESTFIGESI